MRRWLPIIAISLFATSTGIASAQTAPPWWYGWGNPNAQYTPNPNWTTHPHPPYVPGRYSYDNGRHGRWGDPDDDRGRHEGWDRRHYGWENRREHWERDRHDRH